MDDYIYSTPYCLIAYYIFNSAPSNFTMEKFEKWLTVNGFVGDIYSDKFTFTSDMLLELKLRFS